MCSSDLVRRARIDVRADVGYEDQFSTRARRDPGDAGRGETGAQVPGRSRPAPETEGLRAPHRMGMNQTLGIKFRDHGQVYFFDSGPFVVRMGDYVIVRTDQGMGLGQVVLMPREEAAAAPVAAGPGQPLAEVPPLPPDGVLAAFEPLDQSGGLLDLALEAGVGAEEPPAAAADGEAAAEQDGAGEPGESGEDAMGGLPGDRNLKPIYRLATDQDLSAKSENDALAADAYKFCRRCIFDRFVGNLLDDLRGQIEISQG